jgi:biopolymer transport protein ExbD
MGMTAGSGGKNVHPQVNVTPLVDVALVVLIIFMVVTPLAMKTFWLNIPKKPDENAKVPPPDDDEKNQPLVMTIAGDGTIRVDNTKLTREEIASRLPRMLAAKPKNKRVLYFDAHDDVEYGTAVEVMDLARAGGARTIAISTKAIAPEKVSP